MFLGYVRAWDKNILHERRNLDVYEDPLRPSLVVGWWSLWKAIIISKPAKKNLAQHRSTCFSPPARWGLLDFMSVAFSSSCLVLLVLLLVLLLASSSSSSSSSSASSSSSSSSLSSRRPRPTATRDPQCSLPDLNHDHPRPVFPAGPQPRPSTPSVPCRTSTTTIHAQCSLPDLIFEYPCQVFPAGPHVGRYGTKNVQKKVRKNVRRYARRYAR